MEYTSSTGQKLILAVLFFYWCCRKKSHLMLLPLIFMHSNNPLPTSSINELLK